MFRKIVSGAPEYIVAGLGNPGDRYAKTRHNAGFMALDAAAAEYGAKVTRVRFEALTGICEIAGRQVMLLKPQTFMNASGNAVRAAMNYYKLTPDRLIIMLDDVNLDVGVMRIRQKGSDGGQRGMRSIIEQCGTDGIMRIKIGVGKKPTPEYDLADWVLSKLSADELDTLSKTAENAVKALPLLIEGRVEEAMNLYSR